MDNKLIKKIISGMLVAGISAALFSGCGKSGDTGSSGGQALSDETGGTGSVAASEEKTESNETEASVSAENEIPAYDDSNVETKPIDPEVYADYAAWENAEKTGTTDYLKWLADYCINKVEPQAVEMLLRIPAFREAADKGQISRYITLMLDYNDQNEYGAMTQTTFLEKMAILRLKMGLRFTIWHAGCL